MIRHGSRNAPSEATIRSEGKDSAEGGYLGAALHTGPEALGERQTQG